MQRKQELDLPDHGDGAGDAGRGPGHRGAPRRTQWQMPQGHNGHRRCGHHHDPDLDPVESAFAEGFAGAGDPTSFLRLACIPFEATDAQGRRLVLLRVACEAVVEVGVASPPCGDAPMRYAALPRRMTTRRRRLRFIYFDGSGPLALSLAQTRALTAA